MSNEQESEIARAHRLLDGMKLSEQEIASVRGFLTTNPVPPWSSHKKRRRRAKRIREIVNETFDQRLSVLLRLNNCARSTVTKDFIYERIAELVSDLLRYPFQA